MTRLAPEGKSMILVKRRAATRLAAAALASGLAATGAIATAGSAAAEGATPAQGGATATLGGLKPFDQAIVREDGKRQRLGAGLFEMTVDGGGTLQTYCIDIHNPTQEQAKYQEVGWGASSLHDNRDAGKIRWILQNSYPQVNDLAVLAKKAGAGSLSKKTAAAGTQVAIWRYSDDVQVDAVDPEAEKLADYLEKNAVDLAEPKASLALDPPAVSGMSGDRLGPVTVRTNAESVTLAPAAGALAGVKVVGKDGKPVTSAANGTELYFDLPKGTADGSTSVIAQATTKVPVGRVFTGVGERAMSQTQILAGSSESTVKAAATAAWAGKGAAPAITAEKNCVKGGVDVTADNQGDAPFRFRLAGKDHEIAPGKSRTVTVAVAEDQPYKITVQGEGGFKKTFSGVLDCRIAGGAGGAVGDKPSSRPSPATVGGAGGDTAGDTGGDTAGAASGGDLAETGGSSATPMIAGLAVVLMVIGGGTIFLVRKKKVDTGH